MAQDNASGFRALVSLIGVILVLLGLYGSVRTGVNLVFFPKYPTAGVFMMNFGGPMYGPGPREEDCEFGYMGMDIMPGSDGTPLPPEEAKKQHEAQKQSCLRSVVDSREQAKVNDISQSLMFLFLGLGVMVSRKFLFR